MNVLFQIWSLVRRIGGARAAVRQAATVYRKVQTTIKNTGTAEIQELRSRAEAGDRVAQYELGESYYTGSNVPQDYGEAAHWFQKAAERGHPAAAKTLAMLFAVGRGVERDFVRALFWAEKGKKDPAVGKLRAKLISRMTPEQIAEAERLRLGETPEG